MRMLGADVASSLEAFCRPELAAGRERYAEWLSREVGRLFLEDSFDLFVLPSDTFFFVRALPAALRELGIRVVVVQKETTISKDGMESDTMIQGAYAPFQSDLMTVCSERHKEFWVRSGADPEQILVTGQPRFDLYNDGPPSAPKSTTGVLFLSYLPDAYIPVEDQPMFDWLSLRSDTESVLLDFARSSLSRLVVKCHPQQDSKNEAQRLRRIAGSSWGKTVAVAEPDADTRQLILEADVVVGFQSTAIFEAVAAGKRVIYAAWGDTYQRFKDVLIDFEGAPPSCLQVVRGPGELAAALRSPGSVGGTLPACREWWEEPLGPIDGHATDRVVQLLMETAAKSEATAQRQRLESRRRWATPLILARAAALALTWTVAALPARLVGRARGVSARREAALDLFGRALAGPR